MDLYFLYILVFISILSDICQAVNQSKSKSKESYYEKLNPNKSVFNPDQKQGIPEFCYIDPACDPSNPASWPGVCQTGNNQSPLNLQTLKSTPAFLPFTNRGFYRQGTPIFNTFHIDNLGNTVEINFSNSPTTSTLNGPSIALANDYTFEQLHFHWGTNDKTGSEHTINGKSRPLEMHMVHYSNLYPDLGAAVASGDPDAVAVLAVQFEVSLFDNPSLTPIINALPQVASTIDQEMVINRGINPTALLPKNLNFFRYRGSLTTPSCAESVVWTVFKNPQKIGKKQMKAFRTLQRLDGTSLAPNNRPVQARNGRAVQCYHVGLKGIGDYFLFIINQWLSILGNIFSSLGLLNVFRRLREIFRPVPGTFGIIQGIKIL